MAAAFVVYALPPVHYGRCLNAIRECLGGALPITDGGYSNSSAVVQVYAANQVRGLQLARAGRTLPPATTVCRLLLTTSDFASLSCSACSRWRHGRQVCLSRPRSRRSRRDDVVMIGAKRTRRSSAQAPLGP